MNADQHHIDSRWLIYADVLQLIKRLLISWALVGFIVGLVAALAKASDALTITAANVAGFIAVLVVLEHRASRIKRKIRERRARLSADSERSGAVSPDTAG